jgi:cobalt-zinc-cadmium efflux system membrane fusion protein
VSQSAAAAVSPKTDQFNSDERTERHMADEALPNRTISARALPWRVQLVLVALLVAAVAAGLVLVPKLLSGVRQGEEPAARVDTAKGAPGEFYPTKEQWATLTVQSVEERPFRPAHSTEGKIAVNEDHSTPIFSPYAGRVTRLLVQPGDRVDKAQQLFTIEATDMVQAQNDFLTAKGAFNKAQSQVNLLQIVEKRQHALFDAKAGALKDWQQAQADLVAAQNDLRSGQAALEAVRNRLRILGKSDKEIATFEAQGKINPETPIYSPIAGTVTQRKVGPGQYIGTGASDPAYVIGDLSTVWLVANVRESDVPKMKVGQPVEVKVLAYGDRMFKARVTYIAAAVDPNTRRLQVRAEVDNAQGVLKPEMFATFSIVVGEERASPAIPREAVVYEGSTARVWVAKDDAGIELRQVKLGLANGSLVQVLEGLAAGDKVVTRGSLFIDRAATGDQSS